MDKVLWLLCGLLCSGLIVATFIAVNHRQAKLHCEYSREVSECEFKEGAGYIPVWEDTSND